MKYAVLLSQIDEPAKVVPCTGDDVLKECYRLIGCTTVQLVPLYPDRLPNGYDALCDEDRYGKTVCLNPLASWLYGADDHGAGIMGNVVVLKTVETEEGEEFSFMTEDEAQKIADHLNHDYEIRCNNVIINVMLSLMRD